MLRKLLLTVVALTIVAVPALVGAHYYYADSGYYRTTYETREVSEYVPYRKYVCDEDYYQGNHYGYYGYEYTNHRNCYYKTDYRLETRTVKVPVREYVQSYAPTYNYSSHTRRVYDVPRYNNSSYYYPRNTRNVVEYYGYYYDL
jgi:hypothetical protein